MSHGAVAASSAVTASSRNTKTSSAYIAPTARTYSPSFVRKRSARLPIASRLGCKSG